MCATTLSDSYKVDSGIISLYKRILHEIVWFWQLMQTLEITTDYGLFCTTYMHIRLGAINWIQGGQGSVQLTQTEYTVDNHWRRWLSED